MKVPIAGAKTKDVLIEFQNVKSWISGSPRGSILRSASAGWTSPWGGSQPLAQEQVPSSEITEAFFDWCLKKLQNILQTMPLPTHGTRTGRCFKILILVVNQAACQVCSSQVDRKHCKPARRGCKLGVLAPRPQEWAGARDAKAARVRPVFVKWWV